jgi:multimeric flavodoxin WrbA
MKNRVIVIVGSSRNDGDTKKLVDELVSISNFDTLDLNDYNFSYYDYEHKNAGDDFIGLMRKLIDEYDTFLFATPVYWYAMSGIMKVFFDRITDLLDIEKDLGRKLRTKKMAAISCSIGNNLGDNFWFPFIETANYLGMKYVGHLHNITDQLDKIELKKFTESLIEEKRITN